LFREDGLWEPHIVRLYQNLLFQNPDLGVIDIGAHIGQYSLLAASMRRPVVAVEPYPPSLRRLQTAIKINNVDQQVTLTWTKIISRPFLVRSGLLLRSVVRLLSVCVTLCIVAKRYVVRFSFPSLPG